MRRRHGGAPITYTYDNANEVTGDATGDLLGRLGRQARAYRAIQPIINAAMAQGVEVESRMTAFLKESPELARNLARWQADE